MKMRCPRRQMLKRLFWYYIRLGDDGIIARLSTSQYITVHDQQPDVTYHTRRIEERLVNLKSFIGLL